MLTLLPGAIVESSWWLDLGTLRASICEVYVMPGDFHMVISVSTLPGILIWCWKQVCMKPINCEQEWWVGVTSRCFWLFCSGGDFGWSYSRDVEREQLKVTQQALPSPRCWGVQNPMVYSCWQGLLLKKMLWACKLVESTILLITSQCKYNAEDCCQVYIQRKNIRVGGVFLSYWWGSGKRWEVLFCSRWLMWGPNGFMSV